MISNSNLFYVELIAGSHQSLAAKFIPELHKLAFDHQSSQFSKWCCDTYLRTCVVPHTYSSP